jgi:hypothetical protein
MTRGRRAGELAELGWSEDEQRRSGGESRPGVSILENLRLLL